MLPPCEASQHAPFVSAKPLSLPILSTEQMDSETNDQKDRITYSKSQIDLDRAKLNIDQSIS